MGEEKQYVTRMGDGSIVRMTEAEIREDIEAGVADAVKRTRKDPIEPLTEADKELIFEIVTLSGGVTGVSPEKAIVSTSDSGADKLSVKCSIPIERSVNAMIHERALGADSVDIGFEDYNYKTVKGVAKREAAVLNNALKKTTMPLFYGAMPNLGFYTQPDGPVANWAMLLPEGKIDEAQKAQEEAVEHAVNDIVYMAEMIDDVGADGIHLDTCGAAGDADLLAALKSCEIITEKFPNLKISMGMAGEFVLGMHGKLEWHGHRLAGLYPHQQVKIAEEAGASIFGPVVNTNTNMSFPWNIARVCTFIKACSKVSNLPLHPNVGMGVCGIPMSEMLMPEIVSRVDRCLIEICNIDGLQIGVGDPLAMEATHAIAAGMGGVRTTGDLVLRVQLDKKLRIDAAKQYVADKLGLTIEEICDVLTMTEVREERGFGLGHYEPYAEATIGMEAKFHIAEALDIRINSVERFKERAGLKQ